MGCDFYVYIYLEIEHKNGVGYYPLPRKRGWFCSLENIGFYDSDEEEKDRYYNSREYDKLYCGIINFSLTPRKDLVIYSNGDFANDHLREKYLPILKNKIEKIYSVDLCPKSDSGEHFADLSDLIKVTRKEERYEVGEGPDLYSYKDDDDEDD